MTGTAPVGPETLNLHATTVVVGEAGVLVRGASGAGKTGLALAVAVEARRAGRFARIVADDRTLVTVAGGRLVARPHPAIEGLAERRGLGIVAFPYEAACLVRLVVDLAGAAPRLPDDAALAAAIGGVEVPHVTIAVGASTPDRVALILDALDRLLGPQSLTTFVSLTTGS